MTFALSLIARQWQKDDLHTYDTRFSLLLRLSFGHDFEGFLNPLVLRLSIVPKN